MSTDYTKAVFVPAKCSITNRDYYVRYDYGADGRWVLTYGVVPTDINPAERNNSPITSIDLSNSRTGPQFKCPHCGNRDFVKCGRCGELTCYDGSGSFTCKHCGNQGKVTGHIKDLTGSTGKAQG